MVTHTRAPLRTDRLRALNVPRPVTVQISTEGMPVAVGEPADQRTQRTGSATLPAPTHRVDTVLESWRIDDEWWREPIARRYVEVILEGGTHVVLFEDLITGTWFAQTP